MPVQSQVCTRPWLARRRTWGLRQIGPIGTTARVVVGLLLLVSGVLGGRVEVIHGQFRSGFQPLSIGVGLIAFPAVVLGWQWLRSRQVHDRLQATGALPTLVNMLVFAALVLTPLYAPALSFTSGAALVFYGASMLLAALRGYSGCEVLAGVQLDSGQGRPGRLPGSRRPAGASREGVTGDVSAARLRTSSF